MQQKMLRQRQAALQRQRSMARNLLGAGVVAQANPLAQPPKTFKVTSWAVAEGPAASPAARNSPLPTSARDAERPRAEETSTPHPSPSPPEGEKKSGDVDCLAIEEIFDECIQAGHGTVVSKEERDLLLQSAGGPARRPSGLRTGGGAAAVPAASPLPRDVGAVTGAGSRLVRHQHSGLDAEDVMSELIERHDSPEGLGAFSKIQPWDLSVGSPAEPEAAPFPLREEGRKAKGRWWKFGNGTAAAPVQEEVRNAPVAPRHSVEEVTAISNFVSE